jgi:hypothetical protein
MTITLVPMIPAHGDDAAVTMAYTVVAEGFDRALRVENLPDDERARLSRCRALALRHAGRTHLETCRRNDDGKDD